MEQIPLTCTRVCGRHFITLHVDHIRRTWISFLLLSFEDFLVFFLFWIIQARLILSDFFWINMFPLCSKALQLMASTYMYNIMNLSLHNSHPIKHMFMISKISTYSYNAWSTNTCLQTYKACFTCANFWIFQSRCLSHQCLHKSNTCKNNLKKTYSMLTPKRKVSTPSTPIILTHCNFFISW